MPSKSIRTVVICYHGTQFSDDEVNELSEFVKKHTTKNTSVDIYLMDSCDLAKLAALHANANAAVFEKVKDDDPVQSACLLIGTMYFDILSKTDLFMQEIIFGYRLSSDAKRAVTEGNNKALINAIKILGEVDPPENLKNKYKITPKILGMIKKVASNI